MSKCSRCGCEGKEETLRLEVEYLKEAVKAEKKLKRELQQKYMEVKEQLNAVMFKHGAKWRL